MLAYDIKESIRFLRSLIPEESLRDIMVARHLPAKR